MAIVVLVGTLDTKGSEYSYLATQIRRSGCEVIVVDSGILGDPPTAADISREQVAAATGTTIAQLISRADRSSAVSQMTIGVSAIVLQLYQEGRLHAICGLGGSSGSLQLATAMHALPYGVPKLLVSTMASGDTRAYVGISDIWMVNSVVDIAGLNRILRPILDNAATGIAAMATSREFQARGQEEQPIQRTPVIATTMLGVTTAAVTAGREFLQNGRIEVLVFHANGQGGRAMETLISSGMVDGVLDITTAELAADLLGSPYSAGPNRFEAAGKLGIPQVVAPGCLDIAIFGSPDTIPRHLRRRRTLEVNEAITIVGTTTSERAYLGTLFANRVNTSCGPVAVFLPTRGFSPDSQPGRPFHHHAGGEGLLSSIVENLQPQVELHNIDAAINDPHFGVAMATRLKELLIERDPLRRVAEQQGSDSSDQ